MPSTSLKGWHGRTTPLPSSTTWAPSKDHLVLAATYSAPAQPDGFTLALFAPDVAVDAHGAAIRLQPADFAGLVAAARSTDALPVGDWRVYSPITCRPSDFVHVKGEDGSVRRTGVYAFSEHERKLKEPTEGYEELPGRLYELLLLTQEARDNDHKGHGDPVLVEKVKELL